MIITKLIGGLGNQMFQYAAGKALACKHHTELKVDVSELNRNPEGHYTKRHYELGIFASNIQIANETDLALFPDKNSGKFNRELQRRFPFLFNKLLAVESGSNYHSEFKSYPKNTYLSGFWQSELYFKEYEHEIKKDFQFNQSVIEACKPLYHKIANINAVSLHVLRGDYVSSSSAKKFHGL